MATHSSILAWTVPWTEEPRGLQSMGLQSQTHSTALLACLFLKCNCPTTLCQFLLYNMVIYMFPKNHHDKSSYHLSIYSSTYICYIPPAGYFTSTTHCFTTGSLHFLISLPYFSLLPNPHSLTTTCLFSVSMIMFLFCFFICFV